MRLTKAGFAALGIGALGLLTASPALASGPSHIEHFTDVNTSTSNANLSPPSPVAAQGPIHALGTDVPLTDSKDKFVFPKGTIYVTHKGKTMHQSQDPKACLFTFNQTGTFTITSGTGAYKDAHGSGVFSVTGYFLGCGKTARAASVIIHATGSLYF
jgi:hypothetical protein